MQILSKESLSGAGPDIADIDQKYGTSDFLNDVDMHIIPTDLEEALHTNEKCRYSFDRFPDSSKRGDLEWIGNTMRASTRQKHMKETVVNPAGNMKTNHQMAETSGLKMHKCSTWSLYLTVKIDHGPHSKPFIYKTLIFTVL